MSQTHPHAPIRDLIRDVPDFPKPGIMFRDITTVLQDPQAWQITVDRLCDATRAHEADTLVGIEARGFILGAAMAYHLGLGFVPVRKPGKLPAEVHREDYDLEYGTDALELHVDAIGPGHRVVLVDDLLATGGTAAATSKLIARCGGLLVGYTFLIELAELRGRERLTDGVPIASLLSY